MEWESSRSQEVKWCVRVGPFGERQLKMHTSSCKVGAKGIKLVVTYEKPIGKL